MMVRRQLRLAAIAALSVLPGVEILGPFDWDTPAEKLPAIKVRTGIEHKGSIVRSMPEFTSTLRLELQIAVERNTAESAQDAIEALGELVENAIFCGTELVALVQQFANVATVPTFSSEGRRHIAGLSMVLDCEVFETFDPTLIDPDRAKALLEVGVHLDSLNVVDQTGTYASPPFPDSVTNAPRTVGPDGRDEGALNINLPQ